MRNWDRKTPGDLWTERIMTHLAYQPLLPAGNKYLQQKWDKASYELHREKVKSAKSTISTSPPKIFGHLSLQLKKLKLEEEMTKKIQKENNILLEKISRIMRTTGRVDNRNYYDRKSLGNEKRQVELLRITKENHRILFRLSQYKPHYNVMSWDEDWLNSLVVMDSIARYPRGRTKGQEHSIKKCSNSAEDQNFGADSTTHIPESNNITDKAGTARKEKKE